MFKKYWYSQFNRKSAASDTLLLVQSLLSTFQMLELSNPRHSHLSKELLSVNPDDSIFSITDLIISINVTTIKLDQPIADTPCFNTFNYTTHNPRASQWCLIGGVYCYHRNLYYTCEVWLSSATSYKLDRTISLMTHCKQETQFHTQSYNINFINLNIKYT